MCRRASSGSALLMAGVIWLTPAPARAQDKLDVQLIELYQSAIVFNAQVLQSSFPGLTSDGRAVVFEEELNNQLLTSVFTLNSLVAAQVSAFPLASSAGGFSWTFDSSLGISNRTSNSFGPVFAERALTVGRGRFNFGLAYQRTTFDTLQGRDLRDGEIRTYSGLSSPVGGAGGVRSVFFEDTLSLALSTDTVIASGTYGLTDRLDVGAVVPFVRVNMDAQLSSRVGRDGALISTFQTYSSNAISVSGVGDVVARAKFRAFAAAGGGLAVGVDLRLPSGDDENLIGTGAQYKFYGAASTQTGRWSPHANFGYTISRDANAHTETEPDQINFVGGADVAVTSRLTVIADFVGRTLVDSAFPVYESTEFGSNFQQLSVNWGYVNLLLGSAGVKFAPAGRGLVSFSVLFPLNDNGLQDKLSWMGGLELSF